MLFCCGTKQLLNPPSFKPVVMPLFQECCVLIPVTNLEDFPSQLSDDEAQSLLAAWTMLWHPSLLADTEQLPAWYRADLPPEVMDNRLIAVPLPSKSELPEGFEQRAKKNQNCTWIEATSRQEFLNQLPWENLPALTAQVLTTSTREIGPRDFFAAAYASLQVQIMTKRLRYTSNLDELHLQTCAVKAAKAFVAGDASTASESLHDVFDCLAEERDHYFSSDPHLIDLVLTSPSTIHCLPDLLAPITDSSEQSHRDALSPSGEIVDTELSESSNEDSSSNASSANAVGASIPTPINLLVDVDSADAMSGLPKEVLGNLKDLLGKGLLSWAGGGPGRDVFFDAMSFSQAESQLLDAHRHFVSTLGVVPKVYGRFSGSTPADLTATLVQLGYCGIMPIDFEGGTGFGDEAKVILQAAGVQLEALTAKPIDASSDASFLTLGTRLGEAIDRGEISTGLFAHWPGQTSQGFEDLKCVASWGLCLGKFWKLDDYFAEGEHPYHHGESQMVSPHSSTLLSDQVANDIPDPISSISDRFRNTIREEQVELSSGLSSLVAGELPHGDSTTVSISDKGQSLDEVSHQESLARFANSIGAEPVSATASLQSEDQINPIQGDCLIVNPSSCGVRCDVALNGGLIDRPEHLFAVDCDSGFTRASVDVPACGFVQLKASERPAKSGRGLAARLRQGIWGGPKLIAEKDRLQNEFMEVDFSTKTGAVMGVYSGSRGNRLSLRLIAASREKESEVEMVAESFSVKSSTQQSGAIEVKGVLQRSSDESDEVIANYSLEYKLERGSRFLEVRGELVPVIPLTGDPWVNYLGLRTAVASESAICRSLVRDKLHRVRSRRVVAPLGVVIDEAERQTLVCGYGSAFHRRVGERFLDTLISVQGESKQTFHVDYGIDISSPVAACRSRLFPPSVMSVRSQSTGPEIGWVAHVAPREIMLSSIQVHATEEGKLAAVVRVVQTKSQTAKVKLRFCRDVAAVVLVNDSVEPLLQMKCDELIARAETQSSDLKFDGDLVRFGLQSHGICDLLVVFQ